MKTMRIVQVSVGSVRMPPQEGSAPLQVIFNTSKHLARMGHEVLILDRRYHRYDPPVERVEGVEIVRLRAPMVQFGRAPASLRFVLAELSAALFALAVSRYLRRSASNIDIIHLHLTSIGLIVSLLDRGLRNKMFYTCHLSQWALAAGALRVSERVHLLLDSHLMRRVRKVVALNETARKSFLSFGRVKADRIVVLPNGVDTDFFNPNLEIKGAVTRYGLEGKLVVLFVGRFASIKGVEYLIRAAYILVRESGCRDAVFVFAGPYAYAGVDEAIDMKQLFDYIKHHRMEDNIVFTGALPLEEVRVLYAACAIFVLPSLAEGDPLVTLEAMASGKPVIGTRVGGIPNQIREGWNGFLVDPANERQLAERIKHLVENPDERRRMGTNSRQRAVEEFGWGAVAEKLLAAYQS